MRVGKLLIFIVIILPNLFFSQQSLSNRNNDDIIYPSRSESISRYLPRGDEKYITTSDGLIRMFINVWGEVKNPGTHMVSGRIDLLTLLSICGGPTEGANLSKVRIYRQGTDTSTAQIKKVNISRYINNKSDRPLNKLRPNDTVIIPERFGHKILSNLNILTTTLQIVTLYFQIQYFIARTN